MDRIYNKFTKRITAFLLVFIMVVFQSINIFGAVPKPADVFYANDYANVMSEETIGYIVNINDQLYDKTGAQIVVTTTNFTDGESLVDYAVDMFNTWGIGSAEKNNGLLLVLSIVDDDYIALQGDGIRDTMTDGAMGEILDQYLYPYFEDEDYDNGIRHVFNGFLAKYNSMYGTSIKYDASYVRVDESYNQGVNQNYAYSEGSGRQDSSSGFISSLTWIFFIFVIIIIFTMLSSSTRRRRRGGGSFWTGWMLGRSSRRRPYRHNPYDNRRNPPSGGGFGGFGGFGSSGRSGGGGSTRGGGSFGGGGSSRSGGGGSTRGGGVGKK